MNWSLHPGTYVIIDAHLVDNSIKEELIDNEKLIINLSSHFSEVIDAFKINDKDFHMSGEFGEYYLGIFPQETIPNDLSIQGYTFTLNENTVVERHPKEHYIQIGPNKIDIIAHEDMENIADQFSEF